MCSSDLVYEGPQDVDEDAEDVSADDDDDGDEPPDVGDLRRHAAQQVDDHADDRRAEAQRQKPAVAFLEPHKTVCSIM